MDEKPTYCQVLFVCQNADSGARLLKLPWVEVAAEGTVGGGTGGKR
jgi:hypothetical protein